MCNIHSSHNFVFKKETLLPLTIIFTKGLTGLNAPVAVAGVCGCGRLQFLAVLRDLYNWYFD